VITAKTIRIFALLQKAAKAANVGRIVSFGENPRRRAVLKFALQPDRRLCRHASWAPTSPKARRAPPPAAMWLEFAGVWRQRRWRRRSRTCGAGAIDLKPRAAAVRAGSHSICPAVRPADRRKLQCQPASCGPAFGVAPHGSGFGPRGGRVAVLGEILNSVLAARSCTRTRESVVENFPRLVFCDDQLYFRISGRPFHPKPGGLMPCQRGARCPTAWRVRPRAYAVIVRARSALRWDRSAGTDP